MKKIIALVLLFAGMLSTLALSSCGIISKVENAVTYPDSYRITYEITTAEGRIHTLTKTVDANGNIYYKSMDEERLFIVRDGIYTQYKKNADGIFALTDDVRYTREAVEKELSLFEEYAKQTTKQFIPTARLEGEANIAGRVADTYKLGVNILAASFYHVYYVDRESGVCLGVEVQNTVFGTATAANEETFICKEFITSGISDLASKIG